MKKIIIEMMLIMKKNYNVGREGTPNQPPTTVKGECLTPHDENYGVSIKLLTIKHLLQWQI